jgi:hypothetical protein
MLDHVVDHLHDTKDALKDCCLVSKSWIPRSRKHLFANIGFHTAKRLQSWKETFPDPANSPACYTETLYIGLYIIAAGETEVGGLLRDFSRVVRLEVGSTRVGSLVGASEVSFIPFYGFSPILKSIRVVVPALLSSRLFKFILSFPLLEDLAVTVRRPPTDNADGSAEGETPTATQPRNAPIFPGTIELLLAGGMEPFARRLLSLPGGIHPRKLALTWLHEEDLLTTIALVEACAHTLEFLHIAWDLPSTYILYLRPYR